VSNEHFTNPRSRKLRENGEAKLRREQRQAERRERKAMKNGDAVDAAIDEVEAKREFSKRISAGAKLTDGQEIKLDVPYPFTADMFESTVVVLMNMRAESERREAAEKLIVVPKPTLLGLDGRPMR
jgi:Na+-translocating ferredoxin:NAD+ oxidoreductase RnfC subunit